MTTLQAIATLQEIKNHLNAVHKLMKGLPTVNHWPGFDRLLDHVGRALGAAEGQLERLEMPSCNACGRKLPNHGSKEKGSK